MLVPLTVLMYGHTSPTVYVVNIRMDRIMRFYNKSVADNKILFNEQLQHVKNLRRHDSVRGNA